MLQPVASSPSVSARDRYPAILWVRLNYQVARMNHQNVPPGDITTGFMSASFRPSPCEGSEVLERPDTKHVHEVRRGSQRYSHSVAPKPALR